MEAPEYDDLAGALASLPEEADMGDIILEELLDFSNDDGDETAALTDAVTSDSTEVSPVTAVGSGSDCLSGDDGRKFADDSLAGELCEPYDTKAELEWLSKFAEESFSTEDLQNLRLISGTAKPSPSSSAAEISPEPAAFPVKARSKRPRAVSATVWSPLIAAASGEKRQAKEAAAEGRRCRHCLTSSTPQWRTGPMGPKTLCNACGVRYKSGRLVPEYRPAASPTFVLSKHSNSHRKVMELRREKKMQHLVLAGGEDFSVGGRI